MNKKKLRDEIKQQLASMSRPIYEQESFEIAARLYALPDWQNANMIAVTVSADFEVDTWQIIRSAWLAGKRVCVPKCYPGTKEMRFYQLNKFSDLETVYAGLYEPILQEKRYVNPKDIELMIVPGLLFNREGFRIGFGGGYYDRFLASYIGQTISLAFSIQIHPCIPVDHYDIPVQKIVTHQETIIC
ncbi:5-formyltetrahydrofolate cyclo-ligase [Domibacillus robiginosus]|uniref:5-formyltetrahydrofolate cyclo-ligase n=1 Tax=Domibacillus robiginosus TaxID=1071054 RepID=UPI00067D416B|nr:5-formyltetrahydrofolate cyclo-ligase [Domibacillus robiginosus]